ncbi:MAG: ACT domain-containing protein [Eubacteriales bacterium]|nr:ACT domain-containing protein [Eubacteriales bacterium]
MKKKEKKFFIVNKDILPDAILKTAEIKELLARSEVNTINEAVEKVGLSRSAFYKYRDGVFPFYEASKGKIITIAISMWDKSGILSNVLNSIAIAKGNVLTINQGIPLQGVARVSIAIETQPMDIDAEEILERMRAIPGVKKVEILGQS